MYMHENAKQKAEANVLKWKDVNMNICHAHMQLSIRHSGNIIHSYKHSFNMSIIVINSKYICGSKNGQEHLSYDELDPQPATLLQRSTQP